MSFRLCKGVGLGEDMEHWPVLIGIEDHPVSAKVDLHPVHQFDLFVGGGGDEGSHSPALPFPGAGYLLTAFKTLRNRWDKLAQTEILSCEHLQELEDGQHPVKGRLKLGEDKTAEAVPHKDDALLCSGFRQRSRGSFCPEHLEAEVAGQLFDDRAGGDRNADHPVRMGPHHKQGHGRQGQVVAQQVAGVIHNKNLFPPGVEHDAQIGPKAFDDPRELMQRATELFSAFGDSAFVHAAVQRNDLAPQRPQDLRKDDRRRAIGVVDHDSEATTAQRVLIDKAQDSVPVKIGAVRRRGETPDLFNLRATEILPEKEPFNALLPAG